MKWIYENFEFENRLNNLAWTICEDYTEEMETEEKNYLSNNVALYYAINAGARRKYIDYELVKKYLINRSKNGLNREILITLIQISTDILINDKIIKERPGVYDIRKKAYEDILNNYFKIKEDNFLDKVKYTIIVENMGKHPIVNKNVRKVINYIKEVNKCTTTVELLQKIDEIYTNIFNYISSDIETINMEDSKNMKEYEIDFDTFSDFMNEELYSEEESEIEDILSTRLIDSVGENSRKDIKPNNNQTIYIDEENLLKIYEKIEYYYGKSYLRQEDIIKVERYICREIHEGCRVHFTDGVLRSECRNTFQIKYVTRQKDNNQRVFTENYKVYRRSINKLKDNLSRLLKKEEEKDIISAYSGNVVANKLWKINRSNNSKIFTKTIDNHKGRYVVDILLDSSGSQRRNQAKVAIQGYIVSQALTMLGIPNRVMGYCSFLDYTILKRFRDYNSPMKENENIFEYFCAGNNRDGLAIKAICKELANREEENKILIILSDGRPNDVKIGKPKDSTIRGETNYKGMVAIKDTANEVRKARKKGIKVLGVFTGRENDLEVEKIIYGRDFVYIKDIERFTDIITQYLKRIIET